MRKVVFGIAVAIGGLMVLAMASTANFPSCC
jgi:hypothetical protein